MYSSYKHFIYEFLLYLLNSLLIYLTERRKHTHTAPTHENRQTEKEGAWRRPRLSQTILKCYFLDRFKTKKTKTPVVSTDLVSKVHCGSAFEPGTSRLPYYCTPPVCVPDVIGAVLTVWWQNTQK